MQSEHAGRSAIAGPIRVLHFLNQFFGGLGGEERANVPVQVVEGPVGPGRALQHALGTDGRVVATVISGDNFFSEEKERALEAVRSALEKHRPDVVLAGPALNAGRYGLACAEVCVLSEEMGIPAVTGMYPENPGLLQHRRRLYVVPTGESPAEMSSYLQVMAGLALRLGRHQELGPAEVEGYLSRGIRKPGLREKSAAARAVDMVVARLNGKPFQTELPILMPERVRPAAPIADLKSAVLGLITTGGLVPKGNPDRLVRGGAREYLKYSVEGLSSLGASDWESVHRGFYTLIVNQNPNYVLPLNVVRELEAEGVLGNVHPWFFTTSGVGTTVADSRRIGVQIAGELKEAGVSAGLLVAT